MVSKICSSELLFEYLSLANVRDAERPAEMTWLSPSAAKMPRLMASHPKARTPSKPAGAKPEPSSEADQALSPPRLDFVFENVY